MSDDEADPELLALLRAHILGEPAANAEPETGVLQSAEYVADNSIDVVLDMWSCKTAANAIYRQMQEKSYSTAAWSEHLLHPKAKDENTVAFIFTMDLLNFSFWSTLPDDKRFAVEYKGQKYTGYWSLVASLQRALDEDIPITDPHFWVDENECTVESLKHIFRSTTDEEMPLLGDRLACLREAGQVLYEAAVKADGSRPKYACSFTTCIRAANGSAAGLVNVLADNFSCFRDEFRWQGRRKPIRFLKRAQILVADLWACFQGESYGAFRDIDKITMFADYRVPQILSTMGCLSYSPPLATAIKEKEILSSGSTWEMQLRACSIWCVELIRREIKRNHPEVEVNAILIDFFLYDLAKELEAKGQETIPHHRTRSIWY